MIPPQDPDGGYTFLAGFQIDGDGSPRCYAPVGSGLEGLDYLANAGRPGNWWGIATSVNGVPIIQGQGEPCPGYYVSTTSYQDPTKAIGDPARYLDAENVPFAVFTAAFLRGVPGIVKGCLVLVSFNGVEAPAMAGDEGPAVGEGSIKLAQLLGIPGSPKSGGVPTGVTWRFFPSVQYDPAYPLQPA